LGTTEIPTAGLHHYETSIYRILLFREDHPFRSDRSLDQAYEVYGKIKIKLKKWMKNKLTDGEEVHFRDTLPPTGCATK
jgi:hypothetical protein